MAACGAKNVNQTFNAVAMYSVEGNQIEREKAGGMPLWPIKGYLLRQLLLRRGAADVRFGLQANAFNGHFTSRAGRRSLACGRQYARLEARPMNFTAGLVLIAVTIAMVVVARPKNGVSAPFLKVWIVGQAYALTAMVSTVIGITIIISTWPF
jgi:hypothetical protein